MASPLAELLRPYESALAGQEIDYQDPIYQLLQQRSGRSAMPSAPGNVSDVVALGQRLAAKRGWTEDEWNALYQLWQRESGWSPTADNPTSSAFGIPQAMTSVHDVGGRYMAGDPRAQIKWGLNYISGRYGNPLQALAHSNETGWY